MNRRWITLLVVLGALVIVRAAVWLHRPHRQIWPAMSKVAPSVAPPPAPEAAPAAAPTAARAVERAPRPVRAAFDRLLAALRSGDKARIHDALEGVRREMAPAPVPDEENAALLYKKAFAVHAGETDDTDVDILGRLSEGKAITPAERAKLQGYLDRNREALALLHEAAGRPRCNFGLEYGHGAAMEMPHITPLILSARLLEVEAALASQDRRSEIAQVSLRLSEAVAEEPVMLSQLVRTVLHGISAGVGEQEFAGDVPPERLRSLLGLSPEQVREGYERVLLFELYSGVKFVTDGGSLKDIGIEGLSLRRPDDPLTAHDLEYFAQSMSEYAGLAGRPYYEVRGELDRLRAERVDGAPWYAELTRAMLPTIGKALERQATTEASLGTTQLAAALRTWRDEHGAYPPTLEAVREVLPRMPLDPFTGKPYLYRREGEGFVVYTAGPSGIDGGGTPSVPGAEQSVIFRSPR